MGGGRPHRGRQQNSRCADLKTNFRTDRARLPPISEGQARLTQTFVSLSFFPFFYFLIFSQYSVCVSDLAFYLYCLSFFFSFLVSSFHCLNFILVSPLFSLDFYFLIFSTSYEFSPFPSFLFACSSVVFLFRDKMLPVCLLCGLSVNLINSYTITN